MSTAYSYYYIGDHMLRQTGAERSAPLLLTFSYLQGLPRDKNHLHMHAHLELFYFESGSGVLECDGRKVPIRGGDLLVINASSLHVLYSEGKAPLVYYNMAVDRLHIDGLPSNCVSGRPFEKKSLGENHGIHHLVRTVLDEMTHKPYRYISKVCALFETLMIDVLRLFESTTDCLPEQGRGLSNHMLLEQVRTYMEGHYAEAFSLDQLAKLAMMQKNYFLQQFKKRYGISPFRYLNLLRIETAKLLLTSSEKSMTEIAAEVGFNHPAYFSEMFMKVVGTSPTQYRKIMTEQEERYLDSLNQVPKPSRREISERKDIK